MRPLEIIEIIERMLADPDQQFILSTLTGDGYPDSRLMGNICEKSIREITFTCRTGSRKIEELAADPRASLYGTAGPVTFWLYGTATTTRDKTVRDKIWNDRVLPIYPGGVDSPTLTIIRFVPGSIRFRDTASSYTEFDLPVGNGKEL